VVSAAALMTRRPHIRMAAATCSWFLHSPFQAAKCRDHVVMQDNTHARNVACSCSIPRMWPVSARDGERFPRNRRIASHSLRNFRMSLNHCRIHMCIHKYHYHLKHGKIGHGGGGGPQQNHPCEWGLGIQMCMHQHNPRESLQDCMHDRYLLP
jgi:hypothetical protein